MPSTKSTIKTMHPWHRRTLLIATTTLALILSGCAGPQSQATIQISQNHLQPLDFQAKGIAFITSSSVTGQEEDKQAMAMAFVNVMQKARPNLRIVPQSETLSAINRAGLAPAYKRMLEDYYVTGIFDRGALQEVARVTGVRYVAQLKLSGFRQESKNRWGVFGLRIVETQITILRMFLQIWDSTDGSIAWEGGNELTSAHDSTSESTVPFKSAIEEAAQNLIARLPGGSSAPRP